jgi:hypothetical protein
MRMNQRVSWRHFKIIKYSSKLSPSVSAGGGDILSFYKRKAMATVQFSLE